VAIPLVSFGLPIVEVGISVARRLIVGESLFKSDRRHIHHMLLRRGLNQRQVAILLYGVCALFSLFGVMLLNPRRSTMALIFFVIGIGIVLGVQHLRYAEFDALKQKIKQGVAQRRYALLVEVRVRRSSADLRSAKSTEELLTALSELCRSNDFDYVTLEVEDAEWNWAREDVAFAEVTASNRFWSLRVPLSAKGGDSLGTITFYRDLAKGAFAMDLTQVCGLLRQELSIALDRLQRRNQIVFQPAPARKHAAAGEARQF
jgi:hypothetical protein